MNTDFLNQFNKDFAGREFNPAETMQWLTSNINIYFSWGVSKKYNLSNKGLLLKVSAHHHKGYVLITLNGSDLYDVRFFNTSYREVKDMLKDVYCDMLQEAIDEVIEKIDGCQY